MTYMFGACSALHELDVSNFDVGQVTNMSYMFTDCGVRDLDLSNFNTTSLTNVTGIFYGAFARRIDISGFDLSHITTGSQAFDRIYYVQELKMSDGETHYHHGKTWIANKTIQSTSLKWSNHGASLRNILSFAAPQVSFSINGSYGLTVESLLIVFEALPVTSATLTITLGSELKNKLTVEQISIATEKGWTVA